MQLCSNLKTKRKAAGLTLQDVATYLGVQKATVQRYESGVVKNVPNDKLEKLAKLFNTTTDELMGIELVEKYDPKVCLEKYLCSLGLNFEYVETEVVNGILQPVPSTVYQDGKLKLPSNAKRLPKLQINDSELILTADEYMQFQHTIKNMIYYELNKLLTK